MQVLDTIQTTQIIFSPLLKKYTLEEFWELPEPDDRSSYELIEGVLQIVPPPAKPHGKIIANLNRALMKFIIATDNDGTVYHPREAIYLENVWGTYLEPDMMFVSNELDLKMNERRTSAEIVFECISESTATYDRTTKADTYLALGVKELWLIDSDKQTVEVRRAIFANNFQTWEKHLYNIKDSITSKVLDKWQISVGEIFSQV
jgi:Uma2 family endonuclease